MKKKKIITSVNESQDTVTYATTLKYYPYHWNSLWRLYSSIIEFISKYYAELIVDLKVCNDNYQILLINYTSFDIMDNSWYNICKEWITK